MENWEDWHLIYAIAKGGTLAQASRDLGIDYSTVHRRLKAIERRVDARLFERTRSSCTPTPAGERLIVAAKQALDAFDSALLDTAGENARLTGTIRFTTLASLAEWVLMPMLARFHDAYPDIRVELVESMANFNLTQREADVALRFTNRPPDNLIGIPVAETQAAVYGAAEYLDRRPGVPLNELDWIVPSPDAVVPAETRWHQRHVPDERIVLWTNSGSAGLYAARNCMGVCVLVCYLGDAGGLVRISEPLMPLAGQLWLLTHPSLRHVARIRVFLDFLKQEIRAQQSLLLGQIAPIDLRASCEDS